jgi:hypothetical protein
MAGEMQILANMRKLGDVIVLDKLHADGAGPNALGISVLRALRNTSARRREREC